MTDELDTEILEYMGKVKVARLVFLDALFTGDIGPSRYTLEALDRLEKRGDLIKLYDSKTTPEKATFVNTYYVHRQYLDRKPGTFTLL